MPLPAVWVTCGAPPKLLNQVSTVPEALTWAAAMAAIGLAPAAVAVAAGGLVNTTRWKPSSATLLVQSLVSTPITVAAPLLA